MADIVRFNGKILEIYMSTGTHIKIERIKTNEFKYSVNKKYFYNFTVKNDWLGVIKSPHIPAQYRKTVTRQYRNWEENIN